MRLDLTLAALFVLSAQMGHAETYLSNPGLCDAIDGEQELANIAYLDGTGISSHNESCTWLLAPQSFKAGRKARVAAHCADSTHSWNTSFDISVNARGRVTAFADSGTSLPEYYFPCSKWGWKGN